MSSEEYSMGPVTTIVHRDAGGDIVRLDGFYRGERVLTYVGEQLEEYIQAMRMEYEGQFIAQSLDRNVRRSRGLSGDAWSSE